MTYGVDQCRVCGRTITPTGPEAMRRYTESLKAKPTMTEKQWRAAGLKAMPTRNQMKSPHDGCCFDCRLKMGMSAVPMNRLIFPAIGMLVVVLLILFFLGSRFT